ncbi:MAG: ribosome biogenesis GTP-binding protein YihA/YsxC [Pseudomonadota bacterium]
MSLFQHAAFYLSAHHLRDLPPPLGTEIAFAGRSNAGKSSAINVLVNRSRLAFVSKTPGRTQLINFFSLGDNRFLVDLPGYGYADVPEEIRSHWKQVLSAYLQNRVSLRGLVLIMDARRPLTPLDRQMLDWFLPTGKPVHILLTKADKLSRQGAMRALDGLQKELARCYPNCTAQLFSSLKRQGVEEAEEAIAALMEETKSPRLKGSKTGGNKALTRIKAPAQGGEAGDDIKSSAT